MRDEHISLEEASERSGLNLNTLKRLLREGAIEGDKFNIDGRRRWLVSARSLRFYTDPIDGFLLELRGPKLYLKRIDAKEDEDALSEDE